MKIPTVREAPEDFMTRVAALLAQPDTHVYFDTNVLLWVTLLTPKARGQFLRLLDSFRATSHVPTWAMNEFFRMYRDNYLERQLKEAAEKLTNSINEFSTQAKKYGAQSPLAEATFVERVDRMANEAKELKRIAGEWKYEAPALETIAWMNGIACEAGVDFKLMEQLERLGVTRYSHEVPPGYEDDHKKKRKERATNRFGDLLFWKEVLQHASSVQARDVVIVTNDRKQDWYYDQGDPDVNNNLRKLGVSKWEPVPNPHPLLAYEMRDECTAGLVLVDQLYLGAVAWHIDKKNYRQLVGAALAIPEENMTRAEAVPAAPPIKAGGSVTSVQAVYLLRDAFAAPSESVASLLVQMDDEVDKVDSLIASMDPAFIQAMTDTDTVMLARRLGDMAVADHPMARSAASQLIDLIPLVATKHAASIHLGLAVATYYGGENPRSIPSNLWLGALVDYQGQAAVQATVTKLHARLKKNISPALYLLNVQDEPCVIELDLDTQREQDPAELSGARVNGTAVLTNEATQGPSLHSLVGASVASSQQIADVLCSHFALPRRKVQLADADVSRTIPSELFLRLPDRLAMLLEQEPAAAELEFEIGSSGLDDNELVDAQDIEFDEDGEDEGTMEPVVGEEGEGG